MTSTFSMVFVYIGMGVSILIYILTLYIFRIGSPEEFEVWTFKRSIPSLIIHMKRRKSFCIFYTAFFAVGIMGSRLGDTHYTLGLICLAVLFILGFGGHYSIIKFDVYSKNPKKSTSDTDLNADKGLHFTEKPFYLLLNWIPNLFLYHNVDPRIQFGQLYNFTHWNKTHPDSSPARKLSDLFWYSYDWKSLGELHVFDTGCGSGSYGLRIKEAGGDLRSYIGIDVKAKPIWAERQSETFQLKETSSDHLEIPENTNLFITQSAIEHFENDLLFFKQIRDFIKTAKHPVHQIHICPGATSLPLYLFHGVRQYTPRTLSKITRLFPDSDITLIPLGGENAKKIHWEYFTWPILFKRGKKKQDPFYDTKLRTALENEKPTRSPIFWAMVIKSGYNVKT